MNWFEFLILSLAVARLTRLMLFDAGPRGVMDKIRNRFGADAENIVRGTPGHWWNCPWCVSIAWGVAAGIAYYACPVGAMLAATPLALSFAGAVAIKLTHEV